MVNTQKHINIKKGDLVVVNAGKEIGKSGKIIKVDRKKNSVVIEKVNFIKKHRRPTKDMKQGGIVEKEGPINISNVNLLCSKCNKGVRIKKVILDDNKKVRACVKCGEIFDE